MRLELTITGTIREVEKLWFKSLLDHVWLRKADVNYDQPNGKVVIKLRRYTDVTKARTKIL